MAAVVAALEAKNEGSADQAGRIVLQAAALRTGVIPRKLSAPEVIAALFPATALDRIRVLSPEAMRRHSELMIRVMSAEFRHPHHDPRRDVCPFEKSFGLEYERPELRAFETRTRDMELAAIDFGEGEGKAERSDWYLMQGTRRSIRRAYDPHLDDPWAQAEPGSRMARIRSGLLRTGVTALRWGRATALHGARHLAHPAPSSQPVDQQEAPAPEPTEVNLAADPVSDELRLAQHRLANREAAFGFNHPDVASELHFIAALHHEAGQYATAVASYSMALAIRERTLGPDHPEVASTLEDLAAARREDGEPEEAERLLVRAQEIRRRRALPAMSDPKRVT